MHQVAGVGITNQRETTVAWDKTTGKPLHNAIVWHDTRTKDIVSRLKKKELEVKDKNTCCLSVIRAFSNCSKFKKYIK